jgi:hypothetical protein
MEELKGSTKSVFAAMLQGRGAKSPVVDFVEKRKITQAVRDRVRSFSSLSALKL